MIGEEKPAPPVWLNLLVGGTCALQCQFCTCWSNWQEQIPVAAWAGLFKQIAEWIPGRHCTISGWEPLRHPDIKAIIASAHECGLPTSIITSGDPIEDAMIDDLAGWPLDGFAFSIDGFADTHDRLRGRPGLFRKVIGAIERLKNLRPDFTITSITVINRANQGELSELTDYLLDKPEIDLVGFQALTCFPGPDQRWIDPSRQPLWPLPYYSVGFLQWLKRRRALTAKLINSDAQLSFWMKYFYSPASCRDLDDACHVRNYALGVKPSGKVVLCDFEQPIGDILKSDIKDIWYGERARQTREKMSRCRLICNYLINCAFEDLHMHLLSQLEKEIYFRSSRQTENR